MIERVWDWGRKVDVWGIECSRLAWRPLVVL